ncbi:MAG: hypothetical protein ABW250_02470 [Pyrinomonadaceae bacterium]
MGDRGSRVLLTGGVTLQFPWGAVAATVARHDFDLDAALLALESPAPPDVTPTPVGILPALNPWPQGPQALGWHAYGYPTAHQSGMTLTGLISSPHGNVNGNPAVELYCHMGGLGSLEGVSGSAVCHGAYAFGLIRYGPPQLGQMVIHATSLKDIAVKFPEVDALLSAATPQGTAAAQGNTLRQAQITAFGKRLAAFIEEYEAVNAELDRVIDPTMRIRLGRQAERLEESIRKTEAQLNDLR